MTTNNPSQDILMKQIHYGGKAIFLGTDSRECRQVKQAKKQGRWEQQCPSLSF